VVICLERGADLHMFQLMPLPLTVSCFSKIQIGFTFLVPGVCVCVSADVAESVSEFHLQPFFTTRRNTLTAASDS